MSRTMTFSVAVTAMFLTMGVAEAQTAGKPADPVDQLLSSETRVAKPPVRTPADDGETYHRAEDAEQDPAEVRTTQALNDEIASRNQLAENQERADQEAFELERARYQATVDQATRDRLAYEEAVRQSDAAQRQWEIERDAAERARGQYAADVLACRAGDRRRCGVPR